MRGLTLLREAPAIERARAFAAIGVQRGWVELEQARELLRSSVALQRASEDGQVSIPQSLHALALAELDLGNYHEALSVLEEAQSACQARGERWLQALCLQAKADVQRRLGQYEEGEATARLLLEIVEDSYPFAAGLGHGLLSEIQKEQARLKQAWASAQLAVQSPNAFTAAVAKLQLADIASLRGEASEAKRYWGDAIETFERLDVGRGLVAAWDGLGWAAVEEEQHAVAQQYFRQAGDLAEKLELRAQALSVLAGFAASLVNSHHLAHAAELAALVRAAPATEAKTRVRRLEAVFGELRRSLPPSELEAAIQRGDKLDWQVSLREWCDGSAPGPRL